MSFTRLHGFALALAGCAILFVSPGRADEVEDRVRFAAPKRIMAGDKFLGEGRYYPSPVLHDVNGDKRLDIVVGDLFGRVTIAHRAEKTPPVAFAAEAPLKDRDGKPLKFHNW
ncbi:MAG: hypothetical protein ACYTGZ_19280 [Planctomycetota bacterium]|jgi:hypothetical protein